MIISMKEKFEENREYITQIVQRLKLLAKTDCKTPDIHLAEITKIVKAISGLKGDLKRTSDDIIPWRKLEVLGAILELQENNQEARDRLTAIFRTTGLPERLKERFRFLDEREEHSYTHFDDMQFAKDTEILHEIDAFNGTLAQSSTLEDAIKIFEKYSLFIKKHRALFFDREQDTTIITGTDIPNKYLEKLGFEANGKNQFICFHRLDGAGSVTSVVIKSVYNAEETPSLKLFELQGEERREISPANPVTIVNALQRPVHDIISAENISNVVKKSISAKQCENQVSKLADAICAPLLSADQKQEALIVINQVLEADPALQDDDNKKKLQSKLMQGLNRKYPNATYPYALDKFNALLAGIQSSEHGLPDGHPLSTGITIAEPLLAKDIMEFINESLLAKQSDSFESQVSRLTAAIFAQSLHVDRKEEALAAVNRVLAVPNQIDFRLEDTENIFKSKLKQTINKKYSNDEYSDAGDKFDAFLVDFQRPENGLPGDHPLQNYKNPRNSVKGRVCKRLKSFVKIREPEFILPLDALDAIITENIPILIDDIIHALDIVGTCSSDTIEGRKSRYIQIGIAARLAENLPESLTKAESYKSFFTGLRHLGTAVVHATDNEITIANRDHVLHNYAVLSTELDKEVRQIKYFMEGLKNPSSSASLTPPPLPAISYIGKIFFDTSQIKGSQKYKAKYIDRKIQATIDEISTATQPYFVSGSSREASMVTPAQKNDDKDTPISEEIPALPPVFISSLAPVSQTTAATKNDTIFGAILATAEALPLPPVSIMNQEMHLAEGKWSAPTSLIYPEDALNEKGFTLETIRRGVQSLPALTREIYSRKGRKNGTPSSLVQEVEENITLDMVLRRKEESITPLSTRISRMHEIVKDVISIIKDSAEEHYFAMEESERYWYGIKGNNVHMLSPETRKNAVMRHLTQLHHIIIEYGGMARTMPSNLADSKDIFSDDIETLRSIDKDSFLGCIKHVPGLPTLLSAARRDRGASAHPSKAIDSELVFQSIERMVRWDAPALEACIQLEKKMRMLTGGRLAPEGGPSLR